MTENTTASGAADDLHPVFTRVLPDLPDTKPFTLFKAGFRQALVTMASAPVAPSPQPAPLTSSFVQTVPDKCDRIVWRNNYYHLPIAAAPKADHIEDDLAMVPAPLQQGEYLPLPKRRRRFLCTKCGSEQCKDGTENKPYPPCNKCNYLGFAEDCDFNDEEMRAYVDADRAARGAAQAAQDPMLECSVQPRPLSHPLAAYHSAMFKGPLHYTWQDKPHRLVYDLIAAVKHYANQAGQAAPAPASGETETCKCCGEGSARIVVHHECDTCTSVYAGVAEHRIQKSLAAPPAQEAQLNPDMPTQELRLHMGELTTDEVLVARAAIRWANSQQKMCTPVRTHVFKLVEPDS